MRFRENYQWLDRRPYVWKESVPVQQESNIRDGEQR